MKNHKHKKEQSSGMSRRNFLGSAVASAATISFLPNNVIAGLGHTAPSDTLNIAGVGVGGKGKSDVGNADSQNIIALCDVDQKYAAETFEKYPQAKKYVDYREMLENEPDIDAVVISTPDHTHAVIAMDAMDLGKHVYVQKPLTHNVYEARKLTEKAREAGIVSQMGNQGRSGDGIRKLTEWVRSGVIGDVREIHVWTNRPVWPQGLEKPQETPPVPEHLNWDLWLGPAPYREYNPAYCPWDWRAWWDFGTGALGDMGCHLIDPPFMALELGYPVSVQASATPVNDQSAPNASVVHYKFPARKNYPAVDLHWYDGGITPPRPAELRPDEQMGDGGSGVIFVGEYGKIMCDTYARNPRLLPTSQMDYFNQPPKMFERVEGSHQMEWVNAIKNGTKPSSDFDYAGPLTETVLMGNLAIRNLGQILEWNGEKMEVTNYPEANKYVRRDYRNGWEL